LFHIWCLLKISPPEGKKLCPDDYSTVTQTFTPIGATSDEITVSNYMSDKRMTVAILVYSKDKRNEFRKKQSGENELSSSIPEAWLRMDNP